jgi:hypothetical protein
MPTLANHIRSIGAPAVRRSVGPRSNIDVRADYNTTEFNMNNYIMEVAPSDAELGPDIIEKYKDDSPADKAYNKTLLTRQRKPEVVEPPTLATNPNDNLDYLVTGSSEEK